MSDFDGVRLVTLSSNLHSKVILNSLMDLFDSKRGTDFDLRFGGRTVRAHRLILELLLGSNVVSSIAGEQHQESAIIKQEVLDCNDDNNILYSLLEFLYKGEVVVLESELDDLLKIARGLNFGILEDSITSFSSQNDIADNAYRLKEESPMDCSYIGKKSGNGLFEIESCYEIAPKSLVYPKRQCLTNIGSKIPTSETQLFTGETEVEEDLPSYTDDSPYTFAEPEINIVTGSGECQIHESEPKEFESHCNAKTSLLGEAIGESGEFDLPETGDIEDRASNICARSPRVFTRRKVYSCQFCSHTTQGKQGLVRHLNVVHDVGDRRFTCKTCGLRCYNEYELSRHSQTHKRIRKVFVGSQKKILNNPISSEAMKEKVEPQVNLFVCPHCPSSFQKRASLMTHIKVVHGRDGFRCGTCGQRCCSSEELTKHCFSHAQTAAQPHIRTLKVFVSSQKKTEDNPSSQPNPLSDEPTKVKTLEPQMNIFVCIHCPSSFQKRASLMTHIKVVHGRDGFRCGTCGQRCCSSEELTKHCFSHTQTAATSKPVP